MEGTSPQRGIAGLVAKSANCMERYASERGWPRSAESRELDGAALCGRTRAPLLLLAAVSATDEVVALSGSVVRAPSEHSAAVAFGRGARSAHGVTSPQDCPLLCCDFPRTGEYVLRRRRSCIYKSVYIERALRFVVRPDLNTYADCSQRSCRFLWRFSRHVSCRRVRAREEFLRAWTIPSRSG